jgi:hypothetical protein
MSIPIVADGTAEGPEQVRLQALVYPADFGVPIPIMVITGRSPTDRNARRNARQAFGRPGRLA